MRGENWGHITISDTCDIGLEVIISDNGDKFLKSITVRMTRKTVAIKVFNISILCKDFGKDSLLDLVGVRSDIFDELKSIFVFLGESVIIHGVIIWDFGSFWHGGRRL